MSRRRRRANDGGQASLELLGLLPLLLLALLAALQIAFAVSAVQSTTAAARAAARAASQNPGSAQAQASDAARAAVPGWLRDRVSVGAASYPGGNVNVSTDIPLVIPLLGVSGPSVTRSAWFPPEPR